MKLFLGLLFTFSSLLPMKAKAQSYLVYGASKEMKKKLISELGAEEVFTPSERRLLKNSRVLTNVLKARLSEKKMRELQEADLVIEPNHKQELLSEPMQDLQWALKNVGDDLLQWTSDIDATTIQGAPGEDIGIDGVQEDLNREILVAVVDSGVDINHPDLREAVLRKPLECQALEEYKKCLATNSDQKNCHATYSKFDSDGNGYPMDCAGWNIGQKSIPGAQVEGGADVSDSQGHGTHVAGIIAARKNNFGIQGVSQSAKILPVKVAVSSNSNAAQAATDSIAKGILYAVQSKAKIINLSLGWRFDQDSLLMRQMIEHAFDSGALVVAAAGNDSHAAPVYPCSYEGVICVASHTVNGELSDFSNFGSHVDIAAPGTKILSAWPGSKRSRSFTESDTHEYLSGTSQAAPHVSAALAILLNHGMSAQEAKVALFKGARKKSKSAKFIRHGNLSVKGALQSAFSSFIYPVNKSPALIKWEETERPSFLLKLNNLGADAKNVSVKIELVQNNASRPIAQFQYHELAHNDLIEERVHFDSPFESERDFLFKVSIQSEDENKSYFLQGQAVTLISEDSSLGSLASFDILNANNLQGVKTRPFDNATNIEGDDLLGLKAINNRTFLTLLKDNGGSYEQLPWARLDQADPVILNLSKVDIDFDGSPEYVIATIDLKDEKRLTQFFVFDKHFAPSDLKIGPEGGYDNELSVMPGSFQWAKHKDRLVPAWIGVGERPIDERPVPGPWDDAPIEMKINRLYLLTTKGPVTVELKDEETIPLQLLYQNQESKRKGELSIITGDSLGYYKNYSLWSFSESAQELAAFELFPYIDLLNTRPLPVSGSALNSAFFHEPSLGGARMVSIERDGDHVSIQSKRIDAPVNGEAVLRLLSFDGSNVVYQTQNMIGLNEDLVPSEVRADRIRFELLRSSSSLYLNSSESPGLGGSLITVKDGALTRPASRSLLAVGDCAEAGISGNELRENMIFVCAGESETKKILKVSL